MSPRLLPTRSLCRLGFLAAVLVLPGCLPTTINYRPGTPVREVQLDELSCQRRAHAEAPVYIEREFVPGELVAGPPICNAQGQCRPGPARRTPGRWISFDANKELRGIVERRCMLEQGYERVTLPACSDGVRAAVPPSITTVQPRLTRGSCLIRRGNDRYQIVTGSG